MCWQGMPGAMGITEGQVGQALNFATNHFGVKRENILLGGRQTPPDVEWCKVYIYYNGGGAEFWIRKNESWVNWSYLEK